MLFAIYIFIAGFFIGILSAKYDSKENQNGSWGTTAMITLIGFAWPIALCIGAIYSLFKSAK